jgi:hypothetical protein
MTSQVTTTQAEEAFRSIFNGESAPETEKLLDLFTELEPISIDAMIGLWRVTAFGRTPRDPIAEQPPAGPLPQREGLGMRKLYGKRFVDRDHAEPIVCFDPDDGSLVVSVDFGVARLREVAFRGAASAGMVYDQQPWIDYFRKLDDDTLVALIDMKGQPTETFFFLSRG